MKRFSLVLPLVVVLVVGCANQTRPSQAPGLPGNYRLPYHQNFQTPGGIRDFAFTDTTAWRLARDGTNISLELFGKSKYEPKHRSPFNIALLADRTFDDTGKIGEIRIYGPASGVKRTPFFQRP